MILWNNTVLSVLLWNEVRECHEHFFSRQICTHFHINNSNILPRTVNNATHLFSSMYVCYFSVCQITSEFAYTNFAAQPYRHIACCCGICFLNIFTVSVTQFTGTKCVQQVMIRLFFQLFCVRLFLVCTFFCYC